MTTPDLALVYLPIASIDAFPLDPRLAINPEFDRIKASISQVGLEQPLSVCEVPAGRYMVCAGGNTRYRALVELFEETQQALFEVVPCIVESSKSDSQALLAHLRENDLRGHLTFIEKALAVQSLKQLMGAAGKTQRRLAAALTDAGYPVDQGQLSRMQYAVERVYPVLPETLKAGMGRPAIQALRQLDEAARRLWVAWELEAELAYDDVFAGLCSRLDGLFDLELLRNDLEYEIAQAAACSQSLAVLALTAELDPHSSQVERPTNVDGDDVEEPSSEPVRRADTNLSNEPLSNTAKTSVDNSGAGATCRAVPEQDHAFRVAQRLADRYGLVNVLTPSEATAIGFLVEGLPDESLTEQLDAPDQVRMQLMWWTLAALSELTTLSPSRLRQTLSQNSPVAQAIDEGGLDSLRTRIDADPLQWSTTLLGAMDDASWADFSTLIMLYRRSTTPDARAQ